MSMFANKPKTKVPKVKGMCLPFFFFFFFFFHFFFFDLLTKKKKKQQQQQRRGRGTRCSSTSDAEHSSTNSTIVSGTDNIVERIGDGSSIGDVLVDGERSKERREKAQGERKRQGRWRR
jgi:hypothetical protein